MVRDEKYTKMGFFVYKKFYDITYRGMKPRTYEDFIDSNYFTSFSKFGRYLIDIQAIKPEAFVDFLLKAQVPLKNWQLPFVYEQFIRELNKRETATSAVERNILLMQQWEIENGKPWYDFFREVSPHLATHWIQSGRLSPWVLYTATTSQYLFERFTDEQLAIIEKHVDPRFWQRKFDESPEEVAFVKELLAEAGV
jgi:hypothetical protein